MLNLIDLIQRFGIGQQGSPGGIPQNLLSQASGTSLSSFAPNGRPGWGEFGRKPGFSDFLARLIRKKKTGLPTNPWLDDEDEDEIPYIYEWINTSPEGGVAPGGETGGIGGIGEGIGADSI